AVLGRAETSWWIPGIRVGGHRRPFLGQAGQFQVVEVLVDEFDGDMGYFMFRAVHRGSEVLAGNR
ncbi:hypothetical protein, partial [Mycobacterium sp.]|uniref:hypothetical protein n=1 Tax=Mycobacterium sp. TaxID=1785 RepID=UPI003C78BD29